MNEVDEKNVQKILQEICTINKRLNKIESILENVEDITSRMDNHISFIEIVYNRIKAPLDTMLGYFTPTTVVEPTVAEQPIVEELPSKSIQYID